MSLIIQRSSGDPKVGLYSFSGGIEALIGVVQAFQEEVYLLFGDFLHRLLLELSFDGVIKVVLRVDSLEVFVGFRFLTCRRLQVFRKGFG